MHLEAIIIMHWGIKILTISRNQLTLLDTKLLCENKMAESVCCEDLKEEDFITDFFKSYVKKIISLSMFSQSRFINERKEQEQEKSEQTTRHLQRH